ncbi:MAG: hypothetical protein ACFFDF_09870, partial [Candidatus Odinarchaeota archaeon]
IIRGFWTPLKLPFSPFIDIEQITNMCYKWRFLEIIKGCFPRWEHLLIFPRSPTQASFSNYNSYKQAFNYLLSRILKILTRRIFLPSILTYIQNRQSANILQEIIGDMVPNREQEFTITFLTEMLHRLDSENFLPISTNPLNNDYLCSLFVMNEKIDLFTDNRNPIQLRPAFNIEGNNLPTFQWVDKFAGFGTIPLLDFNRKHLRSFCFIAKDFFEPRINWTNPPQYIINLFILPEFLKLWILRLSLSQLIISGRLDNPLLSSNGEEIFPSNPIFKEMRDIDNYKLIVDTIDYTFEEDHFLNHDFRIMTGQALIIQQMLYSNSPKLTTNYSTCLFPDILREKCPNLFTCNLSDNRTNQIPRDRREINVYRFLRYLRDEDIFKHRTYYSISRFYPDNPIVLKDIIDYWIGYLYRDNQQIWIFEDNTPSPLRSTPRFDKTYQTIYLHPQCCEDGFDLKFQDIIQDGIYSINRNLVNWDSYLPFRNANESNKLLCLIGEFKLIDEDRLIRRQKQQLNKCINFRRSDNDTDLTILGRRLEHRDKRVGEAIFGQFSRFV